MSTVLTGLERIISEKDLQSKFKGNIAYLCHSASVTKDLEHGLLALKRVFGSQLTKIFGPQHGFVTDVQDNMVETDHYTHPFFQLPVYSLYSETRIPTDSMLEGLLDQMGFQGESLGDKLKSANQDNFPQLTSAWEVHTIRNRIAHEGLAFELTQHEAKRVIALYEQIFHAYGYI